MRISLLLIGNEIIQGEREDTNAHFVISMLKKKHLYLSKLLVVGDDKNSIKEGLLFLLNCSDAVITSGGLGLTPDDITRLSVSETLKRPLVKDKKTENYVMSSLKRIGRKINQNQLNRLSYIISGAMPIENRVGVAPGMHIVVNNKHIFVLPGVPKEFEDMFINFVFPLLKNEKEVFEKTFLVQLKEADLVELLELIEKKYSVKTASYPPIEGEKLLRIKLIGDENAVYKASEYFKAFLNNRKADFREEIN